MGGRTYHHAPDVHPFICYVFYDPGVDTTWRGKDVWQKSAFDDIIVIMLGAVLSRGVVGANPFLSTVAAGAVMIAIHRLLGWASTRSAAIEKLIKGQPAVLYKDGTIHAVNLRHSSLTEKDLLESLRLETNKDSLADIETACMETNGRISFILKKKP